MVAVLGQQPAGDGPVLLASCGQQVDAGDKQVATQQPVQAASPAGSGNVTPRQPRPKVDPAIASQADKLLGSAVTGLESCNSISAKIVHEVYMYDKHLVGSGFYLGQSKGPDYLMRMELRIQLGDQTSSLVQVCDGHFLWTRRKLPDSDKLTRIDVTRARAGQANRKAGKHGHAAGHRRLTQGVSRSPSYLQLHHRRERHMG